MRNIREIYNSAVRVFTRKSFPVWQRLGLHVTPNHYYQPVPDTRTLNDDLWLKRSGLAGIDMNEKRQIGLLARYASEFRDEYESFPREKAPEPYRYYVNNSSFESVDGEMLYCMVRYFKPKLVFEIGSGNSTYLFAQAVLKNGSEGHDCRLIAFEPFPGEKLVQGFPGLHSLEVTRAQDIPLYRFGELGEDDILFIDSTHVLKTGSDVQYEFLEVLPRLRKGVLVHFHDIFLPAEYRKEWVMENRLFFNEQYLLQAFLSFNGAFEVLWAGSYMHMTHPDKIEAAFSSYRRDKVWPGSFWLRRTR